MLSPQDVPNVFDKAKLQQEIRDLKDRIKAARRRDRRARAIEKIDDALRRGVTRVYFWWGTLDVKTLVDLEFAYKDKGWRVDTIVSNFRNYIEFYP